MYHGGRGSDAKIWFLSESSELVSCASLWRVWSSVWMSLGVIVAIASVKEAVSAETAPLYVV